MQLVADLGQLETDARVGGPEGADEVGHQPGAQRLLEGQGHGAGLGLDELADRGDSVVELVQQRVNVPLENLARGVIRSVRPDRRSSGVPTCASRRRSARETPDWVTASSSLTSVTVVPSATCWNQRSDPCPYS